MRYRYSQSIIILLLLIAGSLSAVTAADLPNIHILATGGTIAGTAENASELAHYQAGNLSVETLIQSVPELNTYARVTGEQICNVNSDEITPEIWLRLANRVNELLKSPDVDGVVITHGTDTLEDTAYFLNLAVKSDNPWSSPGPCARQPRSRLTAP